MTAYAASGDRQKCLAAGMDSYISKPVMPAAIIAAINSYASVLQPLPSAMSPEPDKVVAENAMVPVFDREAFMVRLTGKAELVPRMLTMFISIVATGIENLRNAMTAGNADELHRQAHSIKGASANICAERIRSCATRLEKLAESCSDITTAQGLLDEMEAEFERFKQDVVRLQ
jgi:HPt (histidine-containing phosphotransfer) domain-containing protein